MQRYVRRLGRVTQRLTAQVTDRITDPALAALLIAKASQAAERGVELRLSDRSGLEPVDEQTSEDLTTVVGNLVDNALDAVTATGPAADGSARSVDVEVREESGAVVVTVRDDGPGVAPEHADQLFERGFTTKAGTRGFGLALTRSICLRRGGDVEVTNGGAVFAARLPGVRAAVRT